MVIGARWPLGALASLALLAGCRPDLEGGASRIDSPRVIAIRSEPAEARPNDPVKWSALFVGAEGDAGEAQLDWALCVERKPLAVAGEISENCLVPRSKALVQLGSGAEVSGNLPTDACRLFGPNPPVPKPGDPAARAADPDATGGYYQPFRVRADVGDVPYSVGLTRIDCGIARVTTEQALDYAARYRDNENPEIESVVVDPADLDLKLGDNPDKAPTVKVGANVTLRASWSQCPLKPTCSDGICGAHEDRTTCPQDCTVPHGCTGSEPYVAYDPAAHDLVDRREAMRVSWYATAGSFDHDRSGRAEEEAATPYSDNGWTAPLDAGDVQMWVVLRDDRGGVSYRSYVVHVR